MGEIRAIKHSLSLDDPMDIIDRLRADVRSGKVIAFCIAAVTPEDDALAYASSSKPVTRLRMQGAIAQLLHSYLAGDVSTGGEG